MAFVRAACLILLAACLVGPVRPAEAGSLEACAQRVIRDGYSGGRVDRVYPLGCYRAAIRSLPEDVLQYSNADRDIARALAYARQGLSARTAARAANAKPAPLRPRRRRRRPRTPRPSQQKPPRPSCDATTCPCGWRAAPSASTLGASLPYPVIVLAVLAGVLLLTGGVGWVTARRR